MSECWGYRVNPKSKCIMLHAGPSFEFLEERGWTTGFRTREEAYNTARKEIKKLEKE